MKKQFSFLPLLVIFTALPVLCFSQEPQAKKPAWVPEKGYWVVESNIHTPKNSILYFYNLDNVLVYKEEVKGMKIKLTKKKVRLNLKKVLDQSVAAWETQHIARENDMRVAVALKN
jgi:hypothetical protein